MSLSYDFPNCLDFPIPSIPYCNILKKQNGMGKTTFQFISFCHYLFVMKASDYFPIQNFIFDEIPLLVLQV